MGRFYPEDREDFPVISIREIHLLMGEAMAHTLVDCNHRIPQADCFGCGMDHVFRGLVALISQPKDSPR
jgi:hypothetical protein